MKDYQEAAFSNWDSRKETMAVLYKRILAVCDKLDPLDAVSLTNSLCDTMLINLSDLENLHREQLTNQLLNNVFNSKP